MKYLILLATLFFVCIFSCRTKNHSGTIIIGENHFSQSDQLLKTKLAQLAGNNTIALGLEGFVKGDALFKTKIKNQFGVENGLIFPLEDDFTYSWLKCMIVIGNHSLGKDLNITMAYSASLFNDLELQVEQKLPLEQQPSLVYAFNHLSAEEAQRQGALGIFLSFFNHGRGINPSAESWKQLHSYSPDSKEWFILVSMLAKEMSATAQANRDISELFDFVKIYQFIQEPTPDLYTYIYSMLQEIRNQIFFSGMKEMIANSKGSKLQTFFIIGSDHIQGITELFAKENIENNIAIYISADSFLKSNDNIIE